jgi:hypothetical protein
VKPDARAHRRDYTIGLAPHAEVAAFVRAHHYARGCANTSVMAFASRRGGTVVGAALWMPPTRVCAESVSPDWRNVLALSRLAMRDAEPTNAESIFIGAMVRAIRTGGRWRSLVTFADGSQGHTGTIYRATNWTYIGPTKPEPRWVSSDGRQVSRLATRSRTAADMLALGHHMAGRFPKHKFVMHLYPT